MNYFIISLALLAASLSHAQAEEENFLLIEATEEKLGVMIMAGEVAYTKEFNVAIVNGGDDPIDLSNGCWRLYGPEGTVYALNTVDEKVTSGTLEPEQMAKGFAVFAGADTSIREAMLVKFLPSCS